MDRFWLKSYPPGVPSDIDPSVYPSLAALLEESFEKFRARPAYVCMDKALTFGEIDTLSKAFASWLQGRGLTRGQRVAIMMPNVLQYPVALAAVLRAGLVAVNVNPLYTARELEHQLKDSGAEAVIVLENFASTLQQAIAGTCVKHVVVAAMGDLLGFPKGPIVNFVVRTMRKMVPAWSLPGHVKFNAAVAAGKSTAFVPPDIGPGDVAVLQYTGGTTGVAKGATLLHRTIVANLLASEAWLQPGLKRKPLAGQLTIVCALPLYHVFAFIACGLLGMRTGALNILIPNPRDMAGTIKELAKYRLNIFPGVNTLFNGLANQPDFAKTRLLRPGRFQRRRHGGPGNGGQEMVGHHRLSDRRRLWSQRDLGRRHLQPDRFGDLYRNDRAALAQRRNQDPRRPRPGAAAGRGRRDRHPRAAGHAGLLAAPRRDGAGHDGRRLLQVGRRGRDGRVAASSGSWIARRT